MNLPTFKATIRTVAVGMKNTFLSESNRAHRKRQQKADLLNPADRYTEWLRLFHEVEQPRVYLEIGVATGQTLALKNNDTIGIGVDPAFSIQVPLTNVSLYREPSDSFFSFYRDSRRSETLSINMCFIDGLHEYRQVVRDILNCAQHCSESAVMLIHDVIPPDAKSATAKRRTKLWPGDVYKALPFLHKHFAGIEIAIVRTAPTGLAVITAPSSIRNAAITTEILNGNEKALEEFDGLSVDEYMSSWVPTFKNVEGTPDIKVVRALIGNGVS